MGLLELIATAHMSACEEQHPQFARSGSLRQCTFAAQPCIAQWIGEHPKWAMRWRCEDPAGRNEKS